MLPILCRVVGHKWFFKKKKEEMVGRIIYQYVTHVHFDFCLRCGEPSPSFSSHDQGPERDARIAELEKALSVCERAIKALLIMMGRGGSPSKLDEALTWDQNDNLAESLGRNAVEEIRKALGKGER